MRPWLSPGSNSPEGCASRRSLRSSTERMGSSETGAPFTEDSADTNLQSRLNGSSNVGKI